MSVLNLENLILFKMKAWLDLNERKNKGEKIDSKDIKKHKNDVIRLAANLDADASAKIDGQVRKDVLAYIQQAENDNVDLKNLGIRGTTYSGILERIKMCYFL